MRELIADLTLTAHGRGYKVAIVSPADAMNPNSRRNALLKTLEEPPKRTLMLLVTSQPSRLLADAAQPLLAACVCRGPRAKWRRTTSKRRAGQGRGPRRWLPPAQGLLRCWTLIRRRSRSCATTRLRRLQDIGSGNLQPPAVAERWAKDDLSTRLSCLESWVTDRILESAPIRDVTHLSGAALPPKICRLFEFSDAIRDMRKLAHTSINKTMAVEALLWRWARQ